MIRNQWTKAPYLATHSVLVKVMLGNITTGLPVPPNMTPDDKASCIKMGLAQQSLNKKIMLICKQHPEVMPRYHDLNEYYSRVDSVDVLVDIRGELVSALEKIDNALLGVQDDSFRMSLDYYHSLTRAVKSSVPGLRKQWKEVRDTFIHETGKDIEVAHPEDNGSEDEKTGANDDTVV